MSPTWSWEILCSQGNWKEGSGWNLNFCPVGPLLSLFFVLLSLFSLLSSICSCPYFKVWTRQPRSQFVRALQGCSERLSSALNSQVLVQIISEEMIRACAVPFLSQWDGEEESAPQQLLCFLSLQLFPLALHLCALVFFSSEGTKENNICSGPFKITFSLFAKMDSCCHLQYLTRASQRLSLIVGRSVSRKNN